jgi:hypothetical protein
MENAIKIRCTLSFLLLATPAVMDKFLSGYNRKERDNGAETQLKYRNGIYTHTYIHVYISKWRKYDQNLNNVVLFLDRFSGLVVRVPDYRPRSPGFDSRRYKTFWEVMGLERGPLSLVSTIEELPGRNISDSGLENREYGRGNPLRWPRDTLYLQKLTLTSPTCSGRLDGIVRLRTKTTEFFVFCKYDGRTTSLEVLDIIKHSLLILCR